MIKIKKTGKEQELLDSLRNPKVFSRFPNCYLTYDILKEGTFCPKCSRKKRK